MAKPPSLQARIPVRESVGIIVAIVLVIGAVLGTGGGRAEAQQPRPLFVVVVNPRLPVGTVSRKFLADAFLKKVTRWGDLGSIQPVDLPISAPVRRAFTEDVIRRSVAAVRNYWQQLLFSGRDVPPPELTSENEVIKYVLRVPGAIGYVSGAADLQGAKVLTIE